MVAAMPDVVLPVLDEAAALPWVLGRLPEGFRPIVVDNGSSDGSGELARSLGALVEAVEREAIGRAMAKASGKKVEAARLLGISRPTLDKKLAEYGLGTTRKRGLSDPGAEGEGGREPENTLS